MQWFDATCKIKWMPFVLKLMNCFYLRQLKETKEIIKEIINIIMDKSCQLSIYNYNIKMLINVLFKIFRITI